MGGPGCFRNPGNPSTRRTLRQCVYSLGVFVLLSEPDDGLFVHLLFLTINGNLPGPQLIMVIVQVISQLESTRGNAGRRGGWQRAWLQKKCSPGRKNVQKIKSFSLRPPPLHTDITKERRINFDELGTNIYVARDLEWFK